ncbi:MAG: hypothetical protein ABTQ31_08660 [Rhizobiaceae bacterium]
MTYRIRLPGGTLKVKRYRELRSVELRREVPVWRFGPLYLIWWRGEHASRRRPG